MTKTKYVYNKNLVYPDQNWQFKFMRIDSLFVPVHIVPEVTSHASSTVLQHILTKSNSYS